MTGLLLNNYFVKTNVSSMELSSKTANNISHPWHYHFEGMVIASVTDP